MEKAKALGKDLPISPKHAKALCAFLKNKTIEQAKKLLEGVVDKKIAVKMRGEIPHHKLAKTSGPSRYPQKAAKFMLKLLNNLAANANSKGLSLANLKISKASTLPAPRPLRPTRLAYGRKRFKRCHVQLEAVVEE